MPAPPRPMIMPGFAVKMLTVTRFGGPLNVDVADAGGIVLFLQHFAKFVILNEVIREILLAGIPAGAPIVDNANASAVGIYFLTH